MTPRMAATHRPLPDGLSVSAGASGERNEGHRDAMSELAIDVIERNEHAVVARSGETDIHSAPRMREELVELIIQGRRSIVLDRKDGRDLVTEQEDTKLFIAPEMA